MRFAWLCVLLVGCSTVAPLPPRSVARVEASGAAGAPPTRAVAVSESPVPPRVSPEEVPRLWSDATLLPVQRRDLLQPPMPPLRDWTPPRELDPAWAFEVDALFRQGMPDPRECTYARVRLVGGSLWNERGQRTTTNVFVLPGEPLRVMGWDGIVREAEAVLEPADLDADLALLSDAVNGPAYCHGPECIGLARTLVAVALAARLGNAAPLEALRAWRRELERETGRPFPPPEVAHLAMQREGLLADHALLAYARGADDEAAESLALLASAPSPAVPPRHGTAMELVPLLRLELERRRAQSERFVWFTPERVSEDDPYRGPDLSDVPLQVLIDALDEVDERQFGQPGGVDVGGHPIVQALVARGEAAIPLLLEAVRHDTRATRSIEFFRDFSPWRSVLTTSYAAYVALEEILVWSVHRRWAWEPADRLEAADRLASFVAGGSTPAERFLTVLRDDDAGVEAWAQAAEGLVYPDCRSPVVYLSRLDAPRAAFGERCGDMLDARSRARLASSLPPRLVSAMSQTPADWSRRCALATAAQIWRTRQAVGPLRALGLRCLRDDCPCAEWLADHLAEPSAPEFFGRLLRRLERSEVTPRQVLVLARHRAHPEVSRLWRSRLAPHADLWGTLLANALSDDEAEGFLDLPEARAELDWRLASVEFVGTQQATPTGVVITTTFAEWRSEGSWGREPETSPVRRGDMTAHEIAEFVGPSVTTFSIFDRLEDRDRAIAALRQWLRSAPRVLRDPRRAGWRTVNPRPL